MRWLLYLSLLITLATVSCAIVSVIIPYWLYTRDPQIKYQGLWQRCEPVGSQGQANTAVCELILLPPEFLDAVRVLMLIGIILFSFATILSFMYTCCRREKSGYITAALFLMLVGGIFCMAGVIVYGAMHPLLLRARGLELHAGFGLAVISVIGAFINVLFYCMARARGDVE